MGKDFISTSLPRLMKMYFSDPGQRLRLAAGEVLMDQGDDNDRLFLVLKGVLAGYVTRPGGDSYELFVATENMFVGVYSFFSRTYVSSAKVIAREPCEIAYIDQTQRALPETGTESLFEQFMPVVVENLLVRMQKEQEFALEKELTLKKLMETEKLAVLGQMAAGIAHELNNAIAVLSSNTQWLKKHIREMVRDYRPATATFFQKGIEDGRKLSSRDVRRRAGALQKELGVGKSDAEKLAQIDIPLEILRQYGSALEEEIHDMYLDWEMGAVFYDMDVAATLAAHVVSSVKALAVQKTGKEQDVAINDSIREAVVLLIGPLREIDVEMKLNDLPLIKSSRGEWVQVWTNLIRNAAEALQQSACPRGRITIESGVQEDHIRVRVIDNGPGIPPDVLPRIMQPNFTTKEKGKDFGLGLGLTISSRIVGKYNGKIHIKSRPGFTEFTVLIPAGGPT
ncbi:cyclic nucleotide-binding domain-containing protein [bacterium]|nr:cyclic nucleotide-binding domain-containing protein [bacterium]